MISHSRTILFVLAGAAALQAGETQPEQSASAKQMSDQGEFIPKSAPIVPLSIVLPEDVKLPISLFRRDLDLLYAPAPGKYFLLPVFSMVDMSVRPSGSGTPPPVFHPDGTVNLSAVGSGETIELEMIVIDLLRSRGLADAIKHALSSQPELSGRQLVYPETPETMEATLSIIDPNDEGRPRIVARYNMTRALGKVRHRLSFQITGSNLDLLRQAHRDDVSLEISGAYKCEFSLVDLRVNVQIADDAAVAVSNHLLASPKGQQPTFIVAVGGETDQQFAFRELFHRAVELRVSRRKDAAVDPGLVEKVLLQELANLQEVVKLPDLDKNTIVRFILSNQIQVTAPLGEFDELSDYLKNDRELKTHDLLETLSKEQKSSEVSANTSGSAFGGFFGGSFATDVKYASATEDQKKKIRDRFARDMEEVHKMVKGRIPTVVAMRTQQLQELSSGKHFQNTIVFDTFDHGSKTVIMALSFQALQENDSERATLLGALKKAQDEAARRAAEKEASDLRAQEEARQRAAAVAAQLEAERQRQALQAAENARLAEAERQRKALEEQAQAQALHDHLERLRIHKEEDERARRPHEYGGIGH